LIEQLAEMFGPIVAADYQLRTGNGDRIWEAPAVRMEHRDHGQDHRPGRQVENVGSDYAHRVEDGRAMLVKDSLGISCRAAGVADAARIALVTLVPVIVAILSGKEVVEFVVEADEMRRSGQLGLQSFDDRGE